jgi:hypothetical protein
MISDTVVLGEDSEGRGAPRTRLEFQLIKLSPLMGFRVRVSVPMLREGLPIGASTVARRERGPFADDRCLDLLLTHNRSCWDCLCRSRSDCFYRTDAI